MFYLQHNHAGPKKLRTTSRGVSISEPGARLAPSATLRLRQNASCPPQAPHLIPAALICRRLPLSFCRIGFLIPVVVNVNVGRTATIRAASEPSLEPAAHSGPPLTVSGVPSPPLHRALSSCVRGTDSLRVRDLFVILTQRSSGIMTLYVTRAGRTLCTNVSLHLSTTDIPCSRIVYAHT